MTGENGESRIMRIALGGGEPQFTGLAARNLGSFSVSPDGSRIAYGTSAGTGVSELMVLDHIAQLIKTSK